MKEKLKKYLSKKEYIVFLIALVITLGSFSYAFFISSDILGNNVATTECFKLTLEDSNDINLDKAYPISESEGSSLTPYTFTIKNVCNKVADYQVNIETLSTTTIDTEYIRIKLDNNESSILKSHELNEFNINQNVKEGRKIETGTLRANEEKTYSLRMWIDEESTKEQSANKEYHGKVAVQATPNKEVHDIEIAYIVDGVVQDAPPAKTDGYIIKSVNCENGDGSWDSNGWGIQVYNITGKVACDVEFEEATYNIVPKWLATANIDKNYTTLNEVFNDTDTLSTLTNNQASCDYLVNSTEWINDVVSNENAMTYIGNNDFCADLLFDEENWKNSFINSTYYYRVMNTTVPIMTSDTTPSGKSSVSSSYNSTGQYSAYRAFDGDDSTIWHAAVQSGNFWIQYEFPSSVEIVICYYHMDDGALGRYNTLVIQGSNDGSTWSDLIEPFKPLEPNAVVQFTKNIGKYKYYRWYINGVQPYVHTIQYYGRN